MGLLYACRMPVSRGWELTQCHVCVSWTWKIAETNTKKQTQSWACFLSFCTYHKHYTGAEIWDQVKEELSFHPDPHQHPPNLTSGPWLAACSAGAAPSSSATSTDGTSEDAPKPGPGSKYSTSSPSSRHGPAPVLKKSLLDWGLHGALWVCRGGMSWAGPKWPISLLPLQLVA